MGWKGTNIQSITVSFSQNGKCSFSWSLSLYKGPGMWTLGIGGSKMFPIPYRKKKLNPDLRNLTAKPLQTALHDQTGSTNFCGLADTVLQPGKVACGAQLIH